MARKNGVDRGLWEKVKGSNKWWIVWFDSDGKKRREYAGTKEQARRLVTLRQSDKLRGIKFPERVARKEVYTFGKMADEAIAWSKANKSSWEADEGRLNRVKEEFGDKAAASIKASDFEVYLDRLQTDREISGATINQYRAAIRMAYKHAFRLGKLAGNPAREITPRKPAKSVVRWLSDEEEDRIVAAINNPVRKRDDARYYGPSYYLAEFYFALLTGVRRGEQYSLRWENVDLKAKTAVLTATKNGESRTVQLSSRLIPFLDMLPKDGTGFVFRGGRVGYRYNMTWFKLVLERAGVKDFTWHCLRHTYATRMLRAGVDIRTVQQALGHKSLIMTARYAHVTAQQVREAVGRLDPVTLREGYLSKVQGKVQ